MLKGLFSELSASGKMGIWLLITIISLLLFAFIGALMGYLFLDLSMTDSSLTNYGLPKTISYLKLMQFFQAIGLFIAPPLLAAILFRKAKENYLQFNNTRVIFIVISVLLMVVALPIVNWLAEINQAMQIPEFLSGVETWMHQKEVQAENLMTHFLKADHFNVLLINLFVMAFLPAIGEELLFRGLLQKLFTQMSKNKHLAIWITAFLFSAMHMQFFTFLPRFFMGAMFGYLLVWSGSIWLPIIAHFTNNAIAIISNYLIQHETISPDIENIGQDHSFMWVFSSIVLIGAFMQYIYKHRVILALTDTPDYKNTEAL